MADAKDIGEMGEYRSPGREMRKYFMGGAHAGEVATLKSDVVSFDTPKGKIKQVSFEFHSDPGDFGDLDGLFQDVEKMGMKVAIPFNPDQRYSLGNMSHYRTFTRTEDGLFASAGSGMLYDQKDPDMRDWVLVTKDKELADEVFNEVSKVPEWSKGRDLFYAIMQTWTWGADKIELDK